MSTMTDAEIWNAYLMYCNGVEPKKPQQILLWSKKEPSVPTLKFGDSQRIFKAFVGKGVTLNPNTVNKLLVKTDTPTSITSTTPTSNTSTPTPTSKTVVKENTTTITKKKIKTGRKRTTSTEEVPQSVNWIKSGPPKKTTQGGVLSKHKRRNSVEPLKVDSGSGETVLSAYFKNKQKTTEDEVTNDIPIKEEEQQLDTTQKLPPPPPPTLRNDTEVDEEVTTNLPPPPPTNVTENVEDEQEKNQPNEENEEVTIEKEKEIQNSKPPVNPLFAQLQQGTDITKGLNKVTDDMKTKNRKNRTGVVKSTTKKPPSNTSNTNYTNNKEIERDAKFSKEGNKFIAEYYKEGTIKFDEAKMINEVWIMNSKDSGYLVSNKVKNVLISNCNKIQVEVQDIITTLEIVNCKSVKLYIKGSVPSIQLDKCSDPTLVLFRSALDTKIPKIITSLCSNLEIEMPNKENDEQWNTVSVPYQFQTTIDPETKQMVTVPYDHN